MSSAEENSSRQNVEVHRTTCRVCGHHFFPEPLLHYENMPKAAQFLPDEISLKSESGVDLTVCQCSGCGLVQLNSEPVPYYRDVIRAAAFSEEMKDFRTRQFNNFVQKYNLQGKKIIEVGCGRGEYLSLMLQAGADAYGLENLEDSVRYCVEKGLKVSKGFVENSTYDIYGGPFNAFFMLNFLEHLPSPNATLRGIYNNLQNDAFGLLEVPNFNMILRNKLFSEFIGDHLFYFTQETLVSLLISNGFEIIECTEVWHDYIISAVIRKRKQLDITLFYSYQEKLKNEIAAYITSFDRKKVAIWGAGHQALAVISLANLSDKIKYVVDSAPFKQGKYTPATHIPIVAPNMLVSDPVDAIIVMAASYSDEVARIIKEKIDVEIKIAILRDFGLEIV